MLKRENGNTIGDWIFQDILCQWGALEEIVMDNSGPFINAVTYLAKRYHIWHIRNSRYNSQANGIVERLHFDVRQALVKACEGDISKWNKGVYSVFWAERMMTRKRMGCSPFYVAIGVIPIILLDIVEATYLQLAPTTMLTSTELIARQVIALQKQPSVWRHCILKFTQLE